MKGEMKMNKIYLSNVIGGMRKMIVRHSPEILTGVGIAGMITTVVMAVKATPKAFKILEEEKLSIEESATDSKAENTDADKLKTIDVIKLTWKCYIPSAITGVLSIACLVGASSVNFKRNTALATAYTLSETALREYKNKVVETIGEKKEQGIRDAIAKDRIEKNPIKNCEVFITEKGNTLCYDVMSSRYFKSDIDTIKKAVNTLNRQLLDEMYVSLNDFYYEIGLNNTYIGDQLGWHVDNGLIDLSFSSQLSEDGTPCLVIEYTVAPQYDYRR